MANADNSWVFDSLICFLNGPMWNVPIQSFIEEKCCEFEPSRENESERRQMHNDFKNLVDLLLGSYMEDICISTDQFEIACNQLIQENFSSLFKQNIFEQIWAANDFELFDTMMIEKNNELQKQALAMHKKKLKKVCIVEPTKTEKYDDFSHVPHSEKEVMVEVLEQFESEEEPSDIKVDESVTEETKKLSVIQEKTKIEPDDVISLSSRSMPQVSEEDIKKRQEYLKAQRDKLVALKKQVRHKHLQDEIKNSDTIKNRPKSAKVAEAAISGNLQIKPDVLKFRKTLAEKLRTEVIKK